MSSTAFTARVVQSIAAIDAAAWDACANPPGRSFDEAEGERFNPFLTHAFLHALEASGSVGGRSGWTPVHVTVEDARGRMVAAAPCYLKSHSQGEYVFDHAWADAYERAGGPLLSQAPGRRPVHAGDRTQAPRRRRRAVRRARGADRGFTRIAQADEGVVDSRHLPDRRGRRPARKRRISHPHWRAVPFLLRRLREFRRLS